MPGPKANKTAPGPPLTGHSEYEMPSSSQRQRGFEVEAEALVARRSPSAGPGPCWHPLNQIARLAAQLFAEPVERG
jgi:hypothetical protein